MLNRSRTRPFSPRICSPGFWLSGFWLCCLVGVSEARADDPPDGAVIGGVELGGPIAPLDEGTLGAAADEVRVQRTVQIAGRTWQVDVTAGTLPLPSDDGQKSVAEVFHVAYVAAKEAVDTARPRPLTFCFNGGPGSSSVWLHLGMLGPQRVRIPDDASTPAPPYRLEENPFSLLDRTDLVFIDPVSTGYSRPAAGEEKQQFHGYQEDIKAVGKFIHRYVTRHQRWGSPLFLLGESYGCLRAAGLASHLQQRYGLELNGIVLVSSVIHFQTIRFGTGNDLPFALFLPSYAATAWYHGRLDEPYKSSLPQTIREARRFALNEYWLALMRGDSLNERRRRRVAERVAELTGLSTDYVLDSNLRITMGRFAKELRRSDHLTIGRLDSRFTGRDRDQVDDRYEYDPSNSAITGPFTAGVYQYLQQDLGVLREEPYEVLTSQVHPWNYDGFQNRYVESAESLRQAMTRNPHLQVLVASGYYDLATPFVASEYSFDHLGLPPELRQRVKMEYYESGHMIYIHEPSLVKLRSDLVKFYGRCLPDQVAAPAE